MKLWDHGPLLNWARVDSAGDTTVRFVTDVQITGDVQDLPEVALQRMACLYLLCHFEEEGLNEAFHSLVGIYDHQTSARKSQALRALEAYPRKIKPRVVRRIEPEPISVSE